MLQAVQDRRRRIDVPSEDSRIDHLGVVDFAFRATHGCQRYNRPLPGLVVMAMTDEALGRRDQLPNLQRWCHHWRISSPT